MDHLDVLQKFDQWLSLLGFKATSFQSMQLVYHRDDDRDPDALRGANIILVEPMDGVSSPEEINSRCSTLFTECLNFNKKKMRGANFIAFFVFPMNTENAGLVDYINTTRPKSSSLTGTYIPVILDFPHHSLHYYNPGFSQTESARNKLGNQVENLFAPPLLAPVEIPATITKLINKIRNSLGAGGQFVVGELADVRIGDLRSYARQWFYEGTLNLDEEADRKLLYSWYLTEFLHSLEKQVQTAHSGLSDSLSLASFISQEQFFADVINGLARSFVIGFHIGFDQAMREERSSDHRKKLIKNASIIPLAYCPGCEKVVQLTEENRCENSAFHRVSPPSYFEVNETGAIQIFLTNRGKDG